MSTYPSPDQINFTGADEASPDQEYYWGWQVHFSRLWRIIYTQTAVIVVLLAILALSFAKFQPSIQHVTLDGGYMVVWDEERPSYIDGVEYNPARFRSLVTSFVEGRYGYDHRNMQKINNALRLMSAEAAEEEREKLRALNPASTIIGAGLTANLRIDWSSWEVRAQGGGRFSVSVPGEADINDGARYRDPASPLVTPFTIDLVVQAVRATDTNPLGYIIVSTGRDIL